MKLAAVLLFLATLCQAAEVRTSSRSSQKTEDVPKNEKRALAEGNSGVEKRAPDLPTAPSSAAPGVEYADSKEPQPEKSPTQQVYATPVPKIAKFSDLLTDHGPAFQAAIASHLYSPVSVYQPRLSSPTTYEISAPVASQLAYAEKISYQPQNAVQYTQQVLEQKPQTQQQTNLARLTVNYQQPEQIYVQQPIAYQQQQFIPQIYQRLPQIHKSQLPQLDTVYMQSPQAAYTQNQIQQRFVQLEPQNVQAGITYALQQSTSGPKDQQQLQRELKTAQLEPAKVLEKQTLAPEQNYNTQSQGAVSYASFSQHQPSPSSSPPQNQQQPQHQQQPQYQQEPQYQQQSQYQPQAQNQPQLQYKSQPQRQSQSQYQTQPQAQYQTQMQPQYITQTQYPSQSQQQYLSQSQYHPQAQLQYQIQSQPQYQIQSQPQYQIQSQPQYQIQSQPQYLIQVQPQPQTQLQSEYQIQPQSQHQSQSQSQYQIQSGSQQIQTPTKLEPSSANSISAPTKVIPVNPGRQVAYFRSNSVPIQEQLFQPQVFAGSPGYRAQSLAVAPTYPPVQYFGKFAQAIFGSYQH